MEPSKLSFVVFFAASLLPLSAGAQDPEILVNIGKREIFLGESVLYSVTLNHVDDPKEPTLAGFDAFRVSLLSQTPINRQQVTIINGRRSEINERGVQYDYRLTPNQSGRLTIPAPTTTVAGKQLRGRKIVLNVVAPVEQDDVLIEFSVDRDSVYPMQPFELSVTVAVKDLPEEVGDRDPLSVQPDPPALSVPWLNDQEVPDGLSPDQSWREVLEPMVSQRGSGFQVNGISNGSVFSLLRSRATGFHPTPKRTKRRNAEGEEQGYWEYRFARRFLPQKVGRYAFAPTTLKGTFATGVESGQLTGDRIFAVSPGLEVIVKDVPLNGRPESFVGAVGTFDVDAELSPTNARVGDPMTLTVSIVGQGTLEEVGPPNLKLAPGIEDGFRLYEATEETTGNARKFTYSLRPLTTEVTEFPAIPISFFDVDSERYVTTSTDPIRVEISEAETLSGSEIIAATPDASAQGSDLELSADGVFANDSDLGSLRDETIRPGAWLTAWATLILCWAGTSLGIYRWKTLRADPALLRRRGALARARDLLGEDVESLRRAITGLVADFANLPEAGMTPKDTRETLRDLGVPEPLREEATRFLEDCDAARYGANSDVSSLKSQAADLVDRLGKELPTASRSPAARQATATCLLFLLACNGCSRTPDLEITREFQELETAFAAATETEQFQSLAQRYARLNEQVQSGTLLYNTGNSWMRAGQAGRAIAAYRRAKRFRPRDPYLKANLQSALTAVGRDATESESLGVLGYVFFWQQSLSYREKFLATTALLFCTLAFALAAQLLGGRKVLRRVSIAFALLTLLFFASTAFDHYRFEWVKRGVVTKEVLARKGNSENYQPAFAEPLSEGMEFTVVEQRTDWFKVRMAGMDDEVWLPRQSVAPI